MAQSQSTFSNVTAVYTGDNFNAGCDEIYKMWVQVLAENPQQIFFEKLASITIKFTNKSHESQELLDFKVQDTQYSQLITDQVTNPFVVNENSSNFFFLFFYGKFIGRSNECVEFIFKNITFKVIINILVIHPHFSISPSQNFNPFTQRSNEMRLHHIILNHMFHGIHPDHLRKYPLVTFEERQIPFTLWECFWGFHEQFNGIDFIKMKISLLYPELLETLTHQNYRRKFSTLLYIHEIEETNALQKYAQDGIVLMKRGKYFSINIQNVKEQRLLIKGYKVFVTMNPYGYNNNNNVNRCTFEGVIHSIHQHYVYIKFKREFLDAFSPITRFSTAFMPSRRTYRRLHGVVYESWCERGLGRAFLFPGTSLEYQAPKMIITSLNDIHAAASPEDRALVVKENIEWFHLDLNEEQKCAVINILKAEGRRLPYIIYGPPGTGKTITLTETILQVYINFPDSKILVCAPTNSSIDKLLDMLVASEKISTTSMKRLLSYTYLNSSSYTDKHSDYCVLPLCTNLEPTHEKSMEITDILKSKIILSTMGSVDALKLADIECVTFTHIFIDEAGQMTEPITLHALSMCDPHNDRGQVIMAGDPKQLGPVICSNIAKTCGLGQSMLARYIRHPPFQRNLRLFPEHNGYNPKIITHLIRNYRSLPEIVSVFSDLFYESLVVATKTDDDEEERIFLNSLNSNKHWITYPKGPVIVHGIEGQQSQKHNNPSWCNPFETMQIMVYLNKLHNAGIDLGRIGIVTPYSSQVNYIKSKLIGFNPKPKVGTAELFQGWEEMVIIVSLVRSATSSLPERCMGISGQAERINVAISRARALVIVLGNPETMYANKYLRKILLRAVNNNNYIGCKPEGILRGLEGCNF